MSRITLLLISFYTYPHSFPQTYPQVILVIKSPLNSVKV